MWTWSAWKCSKPHRIPFFSFILVKFYFRTKHESIAYQMSFDQIFFFQMVLLIVLSENVLTTTIDVLCYHPYLVVGLTINWCSKLNNNYSIMYDICSVSLSFHTCKWDYREVSFKLWVDWIKLKRNALNFKYGLVE